MNEEISAERKVIVFQLIDEEYAVPVEQVRYIERMQPITRVPQTDKFVKGVINQRGVVTPIIDLRSRFGMEEVDFNEETRIIIVYLDELEVGLIVDKAKDVIDIRVDAIEQAPEVVGADNVDYIEGVIKLEDRLLMLLDLQEVLTVKERAELKNVEG